MTNPPPIAILVRRARVDRDPTSGSTPVNVIPRFCLNLGCRRTRANLRADLARQVRELGGSIASMTSAPITEIRIMADYFCWPLWRYEGDNVSPSELGLPDDLSASLLAWAAEFDATLDMDNPRDSGFPDEEVRRRWVAVGEGLTRQVAAALGPTVAVTYFHAK